MRSVSAGDQDPPLSLVFDDLGIYYDATAISRLEVQIQEPLNSEDQSRAVALIEMWKAHAVSKYNYLPDFADPLPDEYVLVVDQTRGDESITFGRADVHSFSRMLDSALANHADATIVLKIHPDVWAGKKKGHYDLSKLKTNPRVHVVASDVHPVNLIKSAAAVYVVTSQMGFEGLIWGKPVYTFGLPFYAGYGLTQDVLGAPSRRQPTTLKQLVYACLVRYPRYVHPETLERCEIEDVIEWVGLQRRMRTRFPRHLYAPGFSIWKKPIVRSFLQGSLIETPSRISDEALGATVVVWGMTPVDQELTTSVIRLEDGFLRSVGLGADLTRPISWVMDSAGMYYDATRPSDLENILQNSVFEPSLVERARQLRLRIVHENLTKYNNGAHVWRRPNGVTQVILVPGQVESDASIRYGATAVRRNMELLQSVRMSNPGAHILYKPHPDVIAGLRRRGENEDDASQWCDEVLTDFAMGQLLTLVDEVHVITSLAGFEALLRGKKVVTYGQPFYAGWGLTADICSLERRTRKLAVDELVAGALILYPTYVSLKSGRFTTPENALDELLTMKSRGSAKLLIWHRIFRPFLKVIAILRGKS